MACVTLHAVTTLPTPTQTTPVLPLYRYPYSLIPNAHFSMNTMDAPSAGSFTLDTDLETALPDSLQARVIRP